jgi:hypothetical protein
VFIDGDFIGITPIIVSVKANENHEVLSGMKRLTGLVLIFALTTLVAAQNTNLDLATVTTDTLHHSADDTTVMASWSMRRASIEERTRKPTSI